MTGRVVLSPRAQRDLDEIWDYTAERWGAAQAGVYIRQLDAACNALAADPALARSAAEIKEGYLRHRSGSHIVFCRQTPTGIKVVRILHTRMDFDRHL